jgi:hypothetical protein
VLSYKIPTIKTLLRNTFLTSLISLSIGCNAGSLENDEMVLQISWPSGFFAQGFPTDLRNDNGKIDVSDFPRPLQLFSLTYKYLISHTDFGYSPAMPLYMQFGTEFQTAAAIDLMSAAQFESEQSPVQLIDIDQDSPDYGRRYPLDIAVTQEKDAYRPANLLQVRPVGKTLRENTTYALIATRDFAANSNNIEPNPVLTALLEGRNPWLVHPWMLPADASRTRQVYAPLEAFLLDQGIHAGDVIGATVWTTGNPTRYIKQVVEKVAQWQPQPPLTDWQLREETDDYCVLESSWQAPGLQRGVIPYFTQGTIDFNAEGDPLMQYQRETPIILTIPKQAMPSAGFPMLHYHHGTGGLATQVFERGLTFADGSQIYLGSPAQVAAQRGWAASGMGGHLGADHQEQLRLLDTLLDLVPGFTLNHATYNFLNPAAMRDNLAQMVAERTLYRNLVMSLQLDGNLCPGATTAAGYFYFDADTQAVMGQSLGSMTSSSVAANDPAGYPGVIATGAGTFGVGLALFYSVADTDVGGVIEDIYLNVEPGTVSHDLFHPIWAMAELALSPSNVALQTAKWLQVPDQATSAPHFLIVEGHYDEQVTLPMQRPYLISLGADFINEELGLPAADQLLPDLHDAGYQQLFSPVAGNRDGRTVAVVRYQEDGVMTGHHVAFQYPQPQHQYGCFLENLAQGITPVIIQGDTLGGVCE